MNIVGTDGKVYYQPWAGPVDRFWNYKGNCALIAGGSYSGKALAVDTDIPTPGGFKKMRDLMPGDTVFTPDGRTARVVAATSPMIREAYEIEFIDHTTIVADADHLWLTMTVRDRIALKRRTDEYRARRQATRERKGDAQPWRCGAKLPPKAGTLRTTREIANTVDYCGRRPNHSIANQAPIPGATAQLPIPPYTLGVWLGDGTSLGGGISSNDPEIVAEVRAEGTPIHKRSGTFDYGTYGLHRKLRLAGLLGNKHIPDMYFWADISQRVSLLQGIMDTDGTIAKKFGACSLTLKSKRLMDDVCTLLRSLGIVVSVSPVRKTCTNSPTRAVGTYWRANFTSELQPFRLPRKAARWIPPQFHHRTIRRATPVGLRIVKCIQIDAADGMFLAGRQFIPTHNSEALRWYPWQQIAEDDERIKNHEIERSLGWALITRREMPKLRELIARCSMDFRRACPDVQWYASEKTYIFPNGYRLTFGHMQDDDDWNVYQGWQLTMWVPDELTTFTEKQFDMMYRWVRRPAGSKLTPMVRSGTNWVGAGLEWVREKFYEIAKPETEIVREVTVEVEREDGSRVSEKHRRTQICFIATVRDNKSVDQGEYIASFVDASESIRRSMLEGDPYASEEAFFADVWDKKLHIVKPFPIKADNPSKFRSCHFHASWPGFTSVQWWIVDPDGNLTCYRSLNVANHSSEMLAHRIKELESEAGEWNAARGCSKLTGPLCAAAWPKPNQAGPSIAESMFDLGIAWFKADDDLNFAVDQTRIRLSRRSKNPKERTKEGKPVYNVPGIRWFDTCYSTVFSPQGKKRRTGPALSISALPADETDSSIPTQKGNLYDWLAAAYACTSRPVAPGRDIGEGDRYEDERRTRERFNKPAAKVGRHSGVPGGW